MTSHVRKLSWIYLTLCLIFFGPENWSQTTQQQPLSLSEYTAELDRIVSSTSRLVSASDAAPLIKSIPTTWHVKTDKQTFEISSEWLRSDLGDWQKKPTARKLEKTILSLQSLRAEAASYEGKVHDSSRERAHLDQILASSEFKDVGETTWWDRLKQRVTNWVYRQLERIFSSSAIPTISDILVYGLIGLAVAALAYWMFKTLRDNARLESVLPGTLPVSSKEWTVWLAEAREAANAGRWRDAIHLAYWCGISFLEARDMWPPDRARTPREYLRLLPATSQYHPVLRALTRSFEVVWYGTQPADDKAFSDTVSQLEKLGCRYN